jgi:hypothetical protein
MTKLTADAEALNLQDFAFEDDVSSKGKPVKYIVFDDPNYRLPEENVAILKQICGGYFFYSPNRKRWGFSCKNKSYELHVDNFLRLGLVPEGFNTTEHSRNFFIPREPIPFNIDDFLITFVELQGRPLFYYEHSAGKVEITINLRHWFFRTGDEIEKELAKKFVLSLVGTELQFTSNVLESFFTKLAYVQENLRYSYDGNK